MIDKLKLTLFNTISLYTANHNAKAIVVADNIGIYSSHQDILPFAVSQLKCREKERELSTKVFFLYFFSSPLEQSNSMDNTPCEIQQNTIQRYKKGAKGRDA